MELLPLDIVKSYMSPFDYVIMKRVCKAWRDIVQRIYPVELDTEEIAKQNAFHFLTSDLVKDSLMYEHVTMYGTVEMLKIMLSKGMHILEEGLYSARDGKNIPIIEYLLQTYKDISEGSVEVSVLICLMNEVGNDKVLEAILKNRPDYASSVKGNYKLVHTIEMVQVLLDYVYTTPSDIDILVLHHCIDNNITLLEYILQRKQLAFPYTCISGICKFGNIDMLKLLVKYTKNLDIETCIWIAQEVNKYDLVSYLQTVGKA